MAVAPRKLLAGIAAASREAVRRKVWITAGAYIAIAIAVIEISKAVAESLLFPEWTSRLVTFLLILGFPLAVVLAWIFDVGSHGIQKTDEIDEESDAGDPSGSTGRPTGRPLHAPRPIRTSLRIPAGATTSPSISRASADPADDVPPDPERVRRAALGHVRHELRTPINAILGYSEMLLEDEPPSETKADLQRIRDAGKRLLGLVDSILDSRRIESESGRGIESYAAQIEADLRTPVTSIIGYCEMLVESETEAGRPSMTDDLERIATAARALLATSADIVRVAEEAGDANRVAESTTMAGQVLSKLRPIGAEDAEGEGALLVVDDNATNRDLLTRQLARHGYMVATAADGAEALELLERQAFDLVLLDVIMPNLDGVETLRRIKADGRLRETGVIMLSSLDEVDGAVRCLELGADEYLTRPIEGALLEARIRANLEVRRLRARERLLRERVQEDGATIDRFFTDGIPVSFAERVRAGGESVVDNRPAAPVLCILLDPAPFGAGALEAYVSFVGDAFARFDEAAGAFPHIDARLAEHRGLLAAVFDADCDPTTLQEIVGLADAFLRDLALDDDTAGLARCGVHVGPLIGSLFGGSRPRFDLWGEAVETARAVAELAEPGSVLLTPPVKSLLGDAHGIESVGVREVGRRGMMRLHRVLA